MRPQTDRGVPERNQRCVVAALINPRNCSVKLGKSFLFIVSEDFSEYQVLIPPASVFPAIFERLRNILHESAIDKRVQYMIEVMFAIRKDGFKDHPVVQDGLDLVDEEDQFTHMLPLDDEYDPEDLLSESQQQEGGVEEHSEVCVCVSV